MEFLLQNLPLTKKNATNGITFPFFTWFHLAGKSPGGTGAACRPAALQHPQYFNHQLNLNSNHQHISPHKMSHEGQEELLDYSDSEEIAVQTSAPTDDSSVAKEADKKGSYVGIHATGFRDFLLKAELLRAIGDCGFEHPSEGSYISSTGGTLQCLQQMG